MMKRWAGWTDANVELLEQLIKDGKTSGQASGVLGCTKNAAVGKAMRLGLQFGAFPPAPHGEQRKERPVRMPRAAKAEAPPVEVPPEPTSPSAPRTIEPPPEPAAAPVLRVVEPKPKPEPYAGPKALLARRFRTECGYIVSADGAPVMMCCKPIARGSYCAEHAKRCYVSRKDADAEREAEVAAWKAAQAVLKKQLAAAARRAA
jgi:hypothetical protein